MINREFFCFFIKLFFFLMRHKDSYLLARHPEAELQFKN